MAEYIDRKDVLALIDDFELTLPDDEIFFSYIPVKAVEELPAADVVERKRGKWIWDYEGYHCSECFFHAYGNTGEILSGDYHFCPSCGAIIEAEGANE